MTSQITSILVTKKRFNRSFKAFYAQALMGNKLEIDLPVLCRPLAGTV